MGRKVSLSCCLLAVLASLCLFVVVPTAQAESGPPALITQNIDEGKLTTLGGNTRPEAKAKYDRGLVADTLSMEHMLLQLKRSPEQEQELRQFIDELNDSSSRNFHHWLTAKEFGERFGLAKQDLDAITSWLQSHGLKVNVVYENGLLIDFSGTAGQVREAFHTEIHQLNVKGAKHIANMSDPQIPAALAPAVAGVVSLHDFMPHAMYRPRANYTVTSGGQTYYLVVPSDLATIYNLNPLFSAGISGQGQTIVVIEDTNVYTTADWTRFRSAFGLSSYTSGSFTEVHPAPPSGSNNCTNPGVNSDDEEAIIDAEYSSAAAPSAAIVLASCSDTDATFGGLIALQNLLNESSMPPALVSISYGECEAENRASANAAYNAAYQQAATEGVSVFVSAGDEDAAGCDSDEANATHGIGVSGFASTPYNVAVGGTDYGDIFAGTNSTYWNATNTATYGSAKSYVPEIPWNDSCASVLLAEFNGFSQTYGTSGFCNSSEGESFLYPVGGSGGPSGCATGSPSQSGVVGGTCAGWPKPSWQSLVGNPSDGVRDIPDVSLFAANGVWGHYYPFCLSDPSYGGTCSLPPENWLGAGGTSFSSPIMAGIQALVNQKTGQRQGNPNPVYYSLAASEYGSSGDSSCNSSLGNAAGSSCIFYDVTEGDMDVNCTGTHNCYRPSGAYGVLSTSDSSYQPAYRATTGWDFATGIGTVNAANLVNSWPGGTPNFTLSAKPSTVAITPGASGTSTITITPLNGFSGNITLSASGLPSGVTASFTPNPATTTSTLTLKASATAATGTVTVTIKGKSGTLTNTTMLSLTGSATKQSFSLSASTKTVAIATGGASGKSTITITPANEFSGNVTLASSGLPEGVTASFSKNPATSTSVLTLTASSTATEGTATVTITGTSGSLSATTTITLTVNPLGNFYLDRVSPWDVKVAQGSSGTATITITPTNTFDQSVTLRASGLPSGVTASFSPNPATSTCTLTLAVSGSAATGESTLTVTGTYGSLGASRTFELTVTP